MRLSERRKREIGHLQAELAKRNAVIANHNEAMTKLREDHNKDLAVLTGKLDQYERERQAETSRPPVGDTPDPSVTA